MESYCYNVKTALDEKNIKEKTEESERNAVNELVDSVLEFHTKACDDYDVTTEEIKSKLKEVEELYNPLMKKCYESSGGGMPDGVPGGMPDMGSPPNSDGPTVEEVD